MSRIVTIGPDQTMRLAEIGELTALAYLADGLFDAAHPFVPELRNAKARAEHAILLMMADGSDGQGAAVGTLTVVPSGSPFTEFAQEDEYELRMLAVSPLARGRGIGVELTTFGLGMATARGAKRVLLSTMEEMHAAHAIYEKLGFIREPELDWVAHPTRGKVRCDSTCLDTDGRCREGGHKLLAYAWSPN
jgi:ribosomal protein S18 acetylase RimI-like enzyme